MDPKRARALFNKYTKNQCSPEERELLERFLDSYQEDRPTLHDPAAFTGTDGDHVWSGIQTRIQARNKHPLKSHTRSNLLKYASLLAFLVAGLYGWFSFHRNAEPRTVVSQENNNIILRTDADRFDELDIHRSGDIRDASGKVIASQERDMIIYPSCDPETLIYHELKIPKGKTFKLVLSDGTFVHLNSGSIFRFPAGFTHGMDRKVFLQGEGLFEVAKDASRPFTVNTDDINVDVLGTHFIVSSYQGSEPHTVLIEGSVAVQHRPLSTPGTKHILRPGQKATVVGSALNIEDVDVRDYLGWTDGVLIFNNEPFANIVKKVERRYNVMIKYDDRRWDTIRFNGKFKDETIVDLLETFQESVGFDFSVTGNEVVLH